METVKDFLDAGLIFVDGDEAMDSIDGTILVEMHKNQTDKIFISAYGEDKLKRFAWRKNTGEMPGFSGDIEVEFRGGFRFKDCSDCFDWSITGAENDIIKWRPVISKEDKMEGKINDPGANDRVDIPDCAPIYTKEMHEAGEFKNGDKVYYQHLPDRQYTFIGKHPDGSGEYSVCYCNGSVATIMTKYLSAKPIDSRTDEEKLIDEACAEMIAIDATPIDTSEKAIIELMIKAGYRKP